MSSRKPHLGIVSLSKYARSETGVIDEGPYTNEHLVAEDVIWSGTSGRFDYGKRDLRDCADSFLIHFGLSGDPLDTHLLSLSRALEQEGYPVLNSFEFTWTCGDKYFALERARGLGIPTPQTLLAKPTGTNVPAIVSTVESELSYPLVIKPRGTMKGFGVIKVTDSDLLVSALQLYSSSGMSCLIQEFVESGGREVRCFYAGGELVGIYDRRRGSDRFIGVATPRSRPGERGLGVPDGGRTAGGSRVDQLLRAVAGGLHLGSRRHRLVRFGPRSRSERDQYRSRHLLHARGGPGDLPRTRGGRDPAPEPVVPSTARRCRLITEKHARTAEDVIVQDTAVTSADSTGKAVSFTALSSPYVKGTALRFQARQKDGRWVTLTSATLATTGKATTKITFSHTGTWTPWCPGGGPAGRWSCGLRLAYERVPGGRFEAQRRAVRDLAVTYGDDGLLDPVGHLHAGRRPPGC